MLKTIARWLLRKDLTTLYKVVTEQESKIELHKQIESSLEAEVAFLRKVPAEQVRQTNRLHASEFQRFKRSLPQAVITSTSTELQAAYLVGQQAVLDKLEQELVSG